MYLAFLWFDCLGWDWLDNFYFLKSGLDALFFCKFCHLILLLVFVFWVFEISCASMVDLVRIGDEANCHFGFGCLSIDHFFYVLDDG